MVTDHRKEIVEAVQDLIIARGLSPGQIHGRDVASKVGLSRVQFFRIARHMAGGGMGALINYVVGRTIGGRPMHFGVIARVLQAEYCHVSDELAVPACAVYPSLSDPRQLPPYAKIRTAADRMVSDYGFGAVTRDGIAAVADCSSTTAFAGLGGCRSAMEDSILRWAIGRGDARLVARGLQIAHPRALAAPEALKKAAAKHLI